MKPRVLFVCTGNAGRSQMAETLFRNLGGNEIEVFSAGVEPWPDVHPMARKLMAERGYSMADQKPKHVKTVLDSKLNYVITIGDPARTQCPELPSDTVVIHWNVDDPARADGTPDSEAVFRQTLNELEEKLLELKNQILS